MKRLVVLVAFGAALVLRARATPEVAIEVGPPEAAAADMSYFDGGPCPVLGADAGVNLTLQVTPGDQLMVSYSTYSPVTYRFCKTSACTATANDAPIAAGAQVDLCGRSGYPYVSFNKLFDGGNPPICVYDVIPRTVCPPP